jgi:hypothetical protein
VSGLSHHAKGVKDLTVNLFVTASLSRFFGLREELNKMDRIHRMVKKSCSYPKYPVHPVNFFFYPSKVFKVNGWVCG